MRLNTTTESDTFVYATSPISFGGIAKEDLAFWLLPMAITKEFVVNDPLIAFAVGGFCMWLYKKFTANEPEGHLILAMSVWVAKAGKSALATRIAPLGWILRKFNTLVNYGWFEAGLIPAPQYCNRYEL